MGPEEAEGLGMRLQQLGLSLDNEREVNLLNGEKGKNESRTMVSAHLDILK